MSAVTVPVPKRFTRSEYYRMADAGMFDEQKVELIDGELIQMPPFKNRHVVATGLAEAQLRETFGKGYWVRVQAPLIMSDQSEPEPDLAVVEGSPRDFKEHPQMAALVCEVSETTLLFDRTIKASLYARQNIRDYWIINLIDGRLEVYRKPVTDQARRFGHGYSDIRTLQVGQTIAPLATPGAQVAVADLLP